MVPVSRLTAGRAHSGLAPIIQSTGAGYPPGAGERLKPIAKIGDKASAAALIAISSRRGLIDNGQCLALAKRPRVVIAMSRYRFFIAPYP